MGSVRLFFLLQQQHPAQPQAPRNKCDGLPSDMKHPDIHPVQHPNVTIQHPVVPIQHPAVPIQIKTPMPARATTAAAAKQ